MAVRYVPQFIETDLGFYKDILDRRVGMNKLLLCL